MLTPAPLGKGGPGYYLSLAASAVGYFANEKGLEPEGQWYGECAKEFGLSGRVEAEHLTRLCEGYDPRDGKRLVRNAGGDNRSSGHELCFSAPKSVSAIWALASPELREAIERAMDRAVKDGLDYIQDKCGYARVGAQGQRVERAPLLFACFTHSSSRAGDVQLHTHAVCPNITVRGVKPNGKLLTSAVDPTAFYHFQMSGGAIFRASLSASLRDLGFEIEKDRSFFRIKNVPQELCDRISHRRAEIVGGILEKSKDIARLQGLTEDEILKVASGRMAQIVTLETRKAKLELSREDIFAATREVASEFGLGGQFVESLLKSTGKLSIEEKANLKEFIWRRCIDDISNQHSHWNEEFLTRRLAEEAQGTGLHAADVRELLSNKLAGQELLRIETLVTERKDEASGAWREKTEERFTTPEIVYQECSMLAAAQRMSRRSDRIPGRHVKAAIVSTLNKLAGEGKKLTLEQARAVVELTRGEGQIGCLVGVAGSAKSTTLTMVREAFERSGRRVLGCAVAGVAVDSLRRSSGINSDTLAMLLIKLNNGWLKLTPKDVIVLDEGGMVCTRQMSALMGFAERAGASLLLVGDGDQLQPLEAGGPFSSISRRIPKVATLTEIFRQDEPWRRETVRQLSRGEAREVLIAYAQHDQLHVQKSREECFTKVVDLWKDNGCHLRENGRDSLILASLNSEVRAINRMCQAERLQLGRLSEDFVRIADEKIHAGDRVLLTKRDRKILKVENGFYGEVVAIDRDSQKLMVRLDIDGRDVEMSAKDYGKHLRLGYCSTVHKAQGSTRETVIVLLGGFMMDKHLSYVAASRSTGATHLVCDHQDVKKEPTLGDALRSLAKAMSKERKKNLAVDVLERHQLDRFRAATPEIDRGRSLGV